MKRILSVAMAAAFTVTMPAVQAQGIPTIEACAKYAEADAAYNTVEQEAKAVRKAAMKEPWAAYNAAKQEAEAAYAAARDKANAAYGAAYKAAYKAAMKEPWVAYNAAKQKAEAVYEAAKQEAEPVYEAAIEDARTVLTQTYLAIYAEGGGTQSDVWDVMVKLLTHQRQLCTEHYGL